MARKPHKQLDPPPGDWSEGACPVVGGVALCEPRAAERYISDCTSGAVDGEMPSSGPRLS